MQAEAAVPLALWTRMVAMRRFEMTALADRLEERDR